MRSRCATALVLVPLVAVILFLALYPQLALQRSERSVKAGRGPLAKSLADLRSPASDRATHADRDPGDQVSAALTLLATAHLKGPHIDFAALSPLIALLGGAALVLLVGLLGSRWVRAQRRAGAEPARRSARRSGLTIWQWNDGQVDRLRRAADRRPVADAEPDPDRRRRLHGAARVAIAGGHAKRRTASSTRCC